MPDIVEVRFAPTGVGDITKAFKTIADAQRDIARGADALRKQQVTAAEQAASAETLARIKEKRIREGLAKAEGDAIVREHTRAQREMQQASERRRKEEEKAAAAFNKAFEGSNRNIFGDTRRSQFADRGLREYSSSQAFEQIFGRTTAMLIGLHGPMGQMAGLFNVLGGAVSLASTALTQFGGFIVSDIIKPQLELGTKATQLANRMGGSATGGGVRSAINDLFGKNAQADLTEVTKTFEVAATTTKDQDKAKQVAELALTAQKAYGFDPTKMADFIGKKRAALGDLSPEQFAAVISSQIAASAKGSVTPEQFAEQQGKVENLLSRLAGDGSQQQKAAKEIALSGLLNAATAKGGTASTAVNGLDAFTQRLAQNASDPALKGLVGAGGQIDIVQAIARVVKQTGGNLDAIGPGATTGKTLSTYGLGTFSKSGLDFVRSLGVVDTFKAVGGGAAGEEAVVAQLKRILDPAESAAKMAEDAKKTEADTGYQFDQALRTMKSTLIEAILPTLEKDGPKFAAALADIAKAIKPEMIEGAIEALSTALGLGAYGLLSLLDKIPGTGDTFKDAKHKIGVMTGMESKTEEELNAEFQADKKAGKRTLADIAPNLQKFAEIEGAKSVLGVGAIKNAMSNNGDVDLKKVSDMLEKAGTTLIKAGNKFLEANPQAFVSAAGRKEESIATRPVQTLGS